ncbi:ETS-related transcription factor Elf-5-like [Littorina saxatilis]|uniref:ETS-related transcription factor Elf-5-like n=1 Tax=Littorina saxatilis TaxID=31220 RepID=UPI0038B434D8
MAMKEKADENNNDVKTASSPRKAPQVKSAPLHSGEKAQRKKPGRKKGQVSKVLHLWEFIRDLLNDPNTSPSLITWENEEEGVFRVMQSSEVARLWGEKKKNKRTMTYEKLSRSLRYSRKEGYFDSLPKDRGYPKKLCFKFGPKSHAKS